MQDAARTRRCARLGGVVASVLAISLCVCAKSDAAYEIDRSVNVGDALAITAVPDGSVWVFSRRRFDSADRRLRLFRIDQLGRRAQIELPQPKSKAANVGAFAVGADGNVWVSISGSPANRWSVHRLTPAGRKVSSVVLPRGSSPKSMAPGPDGRMWFLSRDSGHIGRLDRTGRVSRVELKDARSYIQLVQGFNGTMWAVRRGRLARIDRRKRISPIAITDQGEGAVGLVRGMGGRVWFGAPGELRAVGPTGMGEAVVPLQYVRGDGGGGDTSASLKRYPVSLSLRPDGLLGFVAASIVETRDSGFTGPFSIGAIESSLAASESVPGEFPVLLFYAEDYKLDPMDQRGRYGTDRLTTTPDGKQWTIDRDSDRYRAVRFSLDRIIPLIAAKLQIDATVRARRSVGLTLSCNGQAGKFCAGTLAVRQSGSTIIGPRRYAMKPGDRLTIHLSSRRRLPRGELSVVGTAKDPISSEAISTVARVSAN